MLGDIILFMYLFKFGGGTIQNFYSIFVNLELSLEKLKNMIIFKRNESYCVSLSKYAISKFIRNINID